MNMTREEPSSKNLASLGNSERACFPGLRMMECYFTHIFQLIVIYTASWDYPGLNPSVNKSGGSTLLVKNSDLSAVVTHIYTKALVIQFNYQSRSRSFGHTLEVAPALLPWLSYSVLLSFNHCAIWILNEPKSSMGCICQHPCGLAMHWFYEFKGAGCYTSA